ncbi:MAG: response regulator [Anaerolineae bacterium]|nr:response regulator [Anaerolineae bacterium]
MDLSTWQVLVVEDEHDSAQVISEILMHYNVAVFTAHNGYECLDMLAELDPTLIIMDLAMPELDGWQTLMEIRANPATAHIPVIAVTAYHSVNVAQDALLAGFNAYFPKPLHPTNFIDDVIDILG